MPTTETPELEHVLVASTAHLTQAEAQEELAELGRSTLTRKEGFMISTRIDDGREPDGGKERDDEEGRLLSVSALLVMQRARFMGCHWVLFDCDGPVYAGIPTHEW